MTDTITFRLLEKKDNSGIAQVIRMALKEHGVDKPGTVYTDPTTDDLYTLFHSPGSIYWIAEAEGNVVGGCGVYPTKGLPEGCAELVKLYVGAEHRGKGIGYQLMEICFASAREMGYQRLYLETLPELNKAVGMYESLGFVKLDQPLGDSGHFACDIWMLKEL